MKQEIGTENLAEQIMNYEVYDRTGKKVGKVDQVWFKESEEGGLAFVSVKSGWLFGKNRIVPAEEAQIDHQYKDLKFPYTEQQIRTAPSHSSYDELGPSEIQEIHRHFEQRE